MTLTDAQNMIRGFFGALGISSPGLTAQGLGGASIEATSVAFRFEGELLRCSAIVFQFRQAPTPKVLEQLMAYDKREGLSDERGRLVYDAESQTLGVERSYRDLAPANQLMPDLLELARRATIWSNDGIFAAVATKAG